MISLKRYLESESPANDCECSTHDGVSLLRAYRAALAEMGKCGSNACPDLAVELKKALKRIDDGLIENPNLHTVSRAQDSLREVLQSWGKNTAQHYEQKAGEVRDLLLVMARTAASLGQRDEQYAQQLDLITRQLKGIAKLEDVSRIRTSVEESAHQLETSLARITAESRAVIEHLRAEVFTYQTKLEKAEHIASCDALTGLGSRLWAEGRIQQRLDAGSPFSIVMIDVDGFRKVNQEHGNLVGDLILKEFARELRSSCRFSDLVARWGGDAFIVVLDCVGLDVKGQIARLQSWICRPYLVPGRAGHMSVLLGASIGLAEYRQGDSLQELLERADADLCAGRESTRAQLRA